MARHDDYDDYDDDESFDFGSLPEIQQQEFLYGLIGFDSNAQDSEVHNLFWDLMYNDDLTRAEREEIHEQLRDYLYDEYGLDFDDIWDWDDFREWYDSV